MSLGVAPLCSLGEKVQPPSSKGAVEVVVDVVAAVAVVAEK